MTGLEDVFERKHGLTEDLSEKLFGTAMWICSKYLHFTVDFNEYREEYAEDRLVRRLAIEGGLFWNTKMPKNLNTLGE